MKIIEFETGDFSEGWTFSKIALDNFGLFVGASGAGKSKLLNAMFGIADKAANDRPPALQGYWRVTYEHNRRTFFWEYESQPHPQVAKSSITKEILKEIHSPTSETTLIERTATTILLKGTELPKLASTASVLHTLREDPAITPAYEGFKRVMRRKFYGDELGEAGAFQEMPGVLQEIVKKTKSLERMWGELMSLSVRLSLLKQFFPDKFKLIIEYYRSVFPFIKSCEILDLGQLKDAGLNFQMPGHVVPIFSIHENKVAKPIPYQHMSSGMQKVLLIITDIVTLPGGAIYLIDEYENSLGINAINFLPSFLDEQRGDNQVVITSHHPYLINAMSIESWYVFNRIGTNVRVKRGTELAEKYGRSKQNLFTQLLNDPFYTEGVQ